MLIIRPTASLAKRMKTPTPINTSSSTTRLGDWYGLDVVLNRKQFVLFMSSLSRLAVVMSAAPYASIIDRLPEGVSELLGKIGIPSSLVRDECLEMSQIQSAKTMDRSILGTMNENRFQLEHMASSGQVDLDQPLAMSLALAEVGSLKLSEFYPAHAALRLFGIDHTEALRKKVQESQRHLHIVR